MGGFVDFLDQVGLPRPEAQHITQHIQAKDGGEEGMYRSSSFKSAMVETSSRRPDSWARRECSSSADTRARHVTHRNRPTEQ